MAASTSVVNLGELLPALVVCPARHEKAHMQVCADERMSAVGRGPLRGHSQPTNAFIPWIFLKG